MAYADYQDPTYQQQVSKLYPGGSSSFNEMASARGASGVGGLFGRGDSSLPDLPGSNGVAGPGAPADFNPGYGGTFGGGALMPTAPDSNNQLPTNTRQQNLQQVQQAYSTPTRMPGDMGYLNGLLSQSSQAPSADDPMMRGAFAAGRLADQRTFDRQRAALAEQLGAQGLGDSGALSTGTNKFRQQIGENQAARESGMLYDEGNARRNALLQALGLDQNRYSTDQGLGLSLAQLEAQLNQNALQPFFTY